MDDVLEDIQARHDDILKLEKTVNHNSAFFLSFPLVVSDLFLSFFFSFWYLFFQMSDIHQLFQDVALAVEMHTEFINNISMHVTNAKGHVDSGVQALQTGENYLNSSRRCMFATMCILMIVILAISIPIIVQQQ
jgi:t-SNARE complex subunit (syntaxin)